LHLRPQELAQLRARAAGRAATLGAHRRGRCWHHAPRHALFYTGTRYGCQSRIECDPRSGALPPGLRDATPAWGCSQEATESVGDPSALTPCPAGDVSDLHLGRWKRTIERILAIFGPGNGYWRPQTQTSPGRYCHSTLPLTVILVSSLSLSVKMTLSPQANPNGGCRWTAISSRRRLAARTAARSRRPATPPAALRPRPGLQPFASTSDRLVVVGSPMITSRGGSLLGPRESDATERIGCAPGRTGPATCCPRSAVGFGRTAALHHRSATFELD
jgi:hypothetical protein